MGDLENSDKHFCPNCRNKTITKSYFKAEYVKRGSKKIKSHGEYKRQKKSPPLEENQKNEITYPVTIVL